ncbi:DUF1800 family protein [Niveibacterium umoris]|uniref:Uncharacterized protein (DUF1800 family) n=1 Tax=Niveibacterium umoris TaxID=1193620 RepID=A0A840BSJ5_9RHOO|nr:uncharacterized protein (DUF1800 family) [Niveibacterium umoris]
MEHLGFGLRTRLLRWLAGLAIVAALAACGAGGGGTPAPPPADGTNALSTNPPPPPASGSAPAREDAVRFLTQATFGLKQVGEIDTLVSTGYERWLWDQFHTDAASHLAYLDAQKARETDKDHPAGQYTEEMSYEAVWQQWLRGPDQLRARVAFALSEILVISNIAPDLNPLAMSSYMDMLNRNAFGNYRTLLEDVTLHPAMGYYLNMLRSEKEDPDRGTHPNENYAREVLQLFSIGLVKLNPDGSVQLGAGGKPIPTYGQDEIAGFAKAFSGWSFAGADTANPDSFEDGNENWTQPMKAWPAKHSSAEKLLLNGQKLPAGQTPEQDMKGALDAIFQHPNVGPFIGRQLIQRLVTSNPSPAYIQRVADVFANDGSGVRGNLKAVVRAILLDPEARDPARAADGRFGKQREPVIRFANYLRATNAASASGSNRIHYLDSADNALGQSPLLSPSVFNFFSPNYRQPGRIAAAGLYSPEFQITTETSVVGSLNFFSGLVNDGGYGWEEPHRLKMNYAPLEALAGDPAALAERLNWLLYAGAMSADTRALLVATVAALDAADKTARVKAALILTAISPDYVIQK